MINMIYIESICIEKSCILIKNTAISSNLALFRTSKVKHASYSIEWYHLEILSRVS